ncbi:MAG: hypothetical protein ACN6OP_07040 [Pseudomonadales bacterium]
MDCAPPALPGGDGGPQHNPLLGRKLCALDHEVCLIAPQLAAPYRKGGQHM